MINLRTLTLLLALQGLTADLHADETYYPYQFYDDYYRQLEQGPPPAPAPPGEEPVRPEPSAAKRPPLFLFPAELGFGVAAASNEDLFYLAGTYFKVSDGGWYRSRSWRGPWTRVPRGKLPPELSRHTLVKIRTLRNREFRSFWELKGSYRGRVFRPGVEPAPPAVKRPN
ncbi:hypothetical protein KP004_14915 [Geomonas oryzisoli]|uniref:Uncharacterized protein n=1 Tax=Geomonas oryzisoli TaxID=2847992 RepID=A0ABX8J701_9BACT|nr:hypothetical protein [Geomonas oryzisoli]QWV92484.1 hypothetical protein KP004_14915 [Geomonas oryzisoli]